MFVGVLQLCTAMTQLHSRKGSLTRLTSPPRPPWSFVVVHIRWWNVLFPPCPRHFSRALPTDRASIVVLFLRSPLHWCPSPLAGIARLCELPTGMRGCRRATVSLVVPRVPLFPPFGLHTASSSPRMLCPPTTRASWGQCLLALWAMQFWVSSRLVSSCATSLIFAMAFTTLLSISSAPRVVTSGRSSLRRCATFADT